MLRPTLKIMCHIIALAILILFYFLYVLTPSTRTISIRDEMAYANYYIELWTTDGDMLFVKSAQIVHHPKHGYCLYANGQYARFDVFHGDSLRVDISYISEDGSVNTRKVNSDFESELKQLPFAKLIWTNDGWFFVRGAGVKGKLEKDKVYFFSYFDILNRH